MRLSAIESSGIVAGMRGAFPPDVALRVCEALLGEGIHIFEMMMNSEEPIAAMRAVKGEFGEAACVGMGTVLDLDSANAVLDAGADFVVSPAFQPQIVRAVDGTRCFDGPWRGYALRGSGRLGHGGQIAEALPHRRARHRLFQRRCSARYSI